jgi:integrase/recombinase XerD
MSRYPLLPGVGARSPLYQRWVVPYLDFVRHHRGRRTTHQLENNLGRFCAWLDGHGPDGLRQLTPSLLRGFISSLAGFRRSTIATHASGLRGFLAYLRLEGVLDRDLVSAIELPRLYSMAQPPRVLEDDTVERLLTAVDRSSPLGKRDLAMLLLAARYGLRSADIRGLRFDHVHWREQRVVLVQSKTQRRLELPLLAEVDSALVNYIRKGRPACPAREIFVRHVATITPLARRNNLWPVMCRALTAARVEIPTGERGLRLLRHCAATSLLRRGVPFETISDILGHASVDTTRRYAQVDLAGLHSVALSEAEVCR